MRLLPGPGLRPRWHPLEVVGLGVPASTLNLSPGRQARECITVVLPPVVVVDLKLAVNSVPNTTSVWFGGPLAWRYATRALIAWSRTAACREVPSKLPLWVFPHACP